METKDTSNFSTQHPPRLAADGGAGSGNDGGSGGRGGEGGGGCGRVGSSGDGGEGGGAGGGGGAAAIEEPGVENKIEMVGSTGLTCV